MCNNSPAINFQFTHKLTDSRYIKLKLVKNCTKPLSATNQVGGVRKKIANWPIKFFSEELMSGTSDWSDTTSSLNNTVKNIGYSGVLLSK